MIFLLPKNQDTTYRKTIIVFLFLVFTSIFCTTTYAETTADSQHEYILEFPSNIETKLFIKNHKNDIQKVRYTYDSDILTGTAVEFINEKVAKTIVSTYPGITRAWPIHHRIQQQAPITKSFKKKIGLDIVKDDVEDDNTVTVPFTLQNNDTLSILTQANNIGKNLKSNGQDIKIGIIDSGVDYTLAALGGCFGPGCKVAYGHDLVGNNFDGSMSSIQESDDPIDNCPANSTSATGHGTFITGIIVAEDKEYNWTGVAPGAEIGMWKIYGCKYSGTPNDIVIKAMEMAYKAKMDILSISVGVLGGWQEDVLSVVADRLVSKGIHVVTASGNIGTSGIFLTASPATGKNVIAAGSIQNSHVPGYLLKIFQKNNTVNIPYRTFVNSPLVLNDKLPLVPTSPKFNADHDACDTLISNDTTFANKGFHNNKYNGSIALIHKGGCDPLLKISHARAAGARAVVMYTDIKNATTDIDTLTNAVLPVAFINNNDAYTLFKTASGRSASLVAQFTNIMVALEASQADINSVSDFSSLGPTNELQLKPELMAIGGNVFSTLPRYLNGYGFRSGTSFSTPFIAGSIALFLSNTKKDTKPEMVKDLLMNFANQVNEPISAVHYEDSPIRQGAGVIDVVQAITSFERFHVLPAKLSLNDTANFKNQHTITIYNHKQEDMAFQLSHLPSLTATGYDLNNKSSFTPVEPVGLYARNHSAASVEFSSTKLVVPALKSVNVSVHIQPPTKVFTSESHVLYGGYISITSSCMSNSTSEQQQDHKKAATATATIPYFGMIGNMKDLAIFDHSTNPSPAAKYTFPSIGLADGKNTLKSNETGHFHIQKQKDGGTMIGGPYILTRLLTGTAILEIQIMDKKDEIIGEIPIHAQDTPRTWMMRNTLYTTEYSASFYSWNWIGDYVPVNSTLTTTAGEEAKMLESGEYRLKLRALRVFGNRDNRKDWDEWISPKLMLNITQ